MPANNSTIDLLLTRRSVTANDLCEPGPTDQELDIILKSAHRVPDHGKIGPWRFVIFRDTVRVNFGRQLRAIFAENNPQANEKLLAFEGERFNRAPLVIGVVSSPDIEHPKIPQWEQLLSVGAACQNILVAATALGYGNQWLTEWYSYSEQVNELLELAEGEKLAGFIYIGSFAEKPAERVRPDLQARVRYWE